MLHDVFDFPFGRIAEVLGGTPAASRKLASRARARVAAVRERPQASRAETERVLKAFKAAADAGDMAELVELLVLATGSKLVQPRDLPGAERLFDIDTLDGARRLTDHLRGREDYIAVVVGAGFVGLEAATALAARGRVLLVDRSEVVGDQLGPGPRAEIEVALDRLGVERRLATTVTEVGDGYAVLSDGTKVEADAVVWCVGLKASELTRHISGELDDLGRVPVDQQLRALPEVFVAGDTAAAAFDAEHTVMQACQHATPLGKVAGYNAVADLLDMPLRDFTPGPYVTCLDLGGAGAVFTRGWDRRVMASGADGADVNKRIPWPARHDLVAQATGGCG